MLPLYVLVLALFSTINLALAQECQGGRQYDLRTHSCKYLQCPDKSIGTYPNCTCMKNHYVYNVYFNLCASYCPGNSTGSPPECKCNDERLDYSVDKHICGARKCPQQDSTGIYPNCSCTHENFDYSADFNICFRVCPENSTGYWPECTCNNDGYFFDKRKFQCLTCPPKSTGSYPNCDCSKSMTFTDRCNKCEVCANKSIGVYPDCTCTEDGYIFSALANECLLPWDISSDTEESTLNQVNSQCPINTVGTFPRCTCENNGTYDYISQLCHTCDASEAYSLHLHRCVQCSGTDVYNPTYGICVPAEIQCPPDSVGLHPYCTCDKSKYNSDLRTCDTCGDDGYYSSRLDDCVQCTNDGYYEESTGRCIHCPVHATGIHPNCKCVDKGETYDVYENKCGRRCDAEDFPSKIDECELGLYYDLDESICKIVIGEKCPIHSIGTGPDCLCVNKDQKFAPAYWSCESTTSQGSAVGELETFEDLTPIDALVLKTMVG